MKRLKSIALLLMSGAMVMGFTPRGVAEGVESRRVVLDKVVAVVGSSSILLSDVNRYVAQIKEQQLREGYTPDGDPKTEALEALLTQKLLFNQAQIDSVEISQGDIAARVEQQIAAMSEEAGGIRALETRQNMEIFNIRDMLNEAMQEQAYAQSMRSTVTSKVTIVPGEVEQYYKRRDRDSLPMIGEQYRYAQITRFPASMDEAKRRIKEQLLGMREKVISGKSQFSSLAIMYSLDPGSAYRGGEMEPQPASAFVPAFAEALESLKPGQISEVIETEFGFHIIELIDTKGELYHCRHILLRPSYSTDELMEPINLLDSLVTEIRRDSTTFERAAMEFSDDIHSKMNGGIVTNHDLLERYSAYDAKLTVTKFLKEDFGARGYKSLDDYAALSKLKAGEISSAFATQDMVGNQMGKIVKLVEVFPAHQASLEEDYLRLEKLALEDKQSRVFDSWLNDHIDAMYIFIAPEYRDLKFKNPRWVK